MARKGVLATFAHDGDMRAFEFDLFAVANIGGVAGNCHKAFACDAAESGNWQLSKKPYISLIP
ncbi:MAG: hypothetical protein U9P00_00010 [Pseudomonadota bacterium]|nr:hypothetical protein [Pseudomonadota bacterium]